MHFCSNKIKIIYWFERKRKLRLVHKHESYEIEIPKYFEVKSSSDTCSSKTYKTPYYHDLTLLRKPKG